MRTSRLLVVTLVLVIGALAPMWLRVEAAPLLAEIQPEEQHGEHLGEEGLRGRHPDLGAAVEI